MAGKFIPKTSKINNQQNPNLKLTRISQQHTWSNQSMRGHLFIRAFAQLASCLFRLSLHADIQGTGTGTAHNHFDWKRLCQDVGAYVALIRQINNVIRHHTSCLWHDILLWMSQADIYIV